MTTSTTPNLIATLESYLNPALTIDSSSATPADKTLPALHLLPSSTLSKLRNLGPARVKDMRLVLGQARQVISHVPISASPQVCARCNDALYAAVRLNGERFSGLAMLPGGRGEGREAAKELQRCVSKYGFVGGVVGLKRGDGGEGIVSDGGWEEVWGTAVKCRVPIALRELWPSSAEVRYHDYSHTRKGRVDEGLDTKLPAQPTRHCHGSHPHAPTYVSFCLASTIPPYLPWRHLRSPSQPPSHPLPSRRAAFPPPVHREAAVEHP
ncbi:hypothetical protein IAQ61_006162 [Plenodomus lingam]|uniref:uncharacterized protein n=1 Tax=Leptosphaeria maculans TaxID=5022 RepID=UPI0033321CD3|nr:hypothetical protein IAQ61_006162 [Plenodomus lingam]